MILWTTFRVALRALQRNKLRTILTMLGIIIGVGAVITMVSIGQGAKAQVEKQIASLGQNVILVMSGNFSRGGFRMGFGTSGTLTVEDYAAIRREVSGVSAGSPEVRSFAQVTVGNQNANTSITGVDVDYLELRSWPLSAGANFTEQDVRNANKVALIGRTVAELLFGDGDSLGQVVRIRNAPFTIIGVLGPKGMSMSGSDEDDRILVPYTSAMKRLSGQTFLRSLNIQAAGANQIQEVQEQMVALLRQRHRITPDREDDFTVRTQEEIASMATATASIMTALLGSIAGVSLLVGGIGIMNIMLVSVTERTREIGIRMSVGARGRDILLQFLIEAVTLSVGGGLIGIGSGFGLSRLLTAKMGWATYVSPDSILLAFAFSAGVGIFFGFYPARQAARLDPIEALRYE